MSKTLKPQRLTDFIGRVLRGLKAPVINAAEVYIEHYDDDYRSTRRSAAQSVKMEQSEHGPVKIIISDCE